MKRFMGLLAAAVALVAGGTAPALASSTEHPRASGASTQRTQRATDAATVRGVTISPLRGDRWALPGTQISFLGAPARALSQISVVGSSSHHHTGRLRSYVSKSGASFIPFRHFSPGEHVTVRARLSTSKGTRSLSTSFVVARPMGVSTAGFPPQGNPNDVQSFRSRPDLKPPSITITQPAGQVAPGLLMTAPDIGPGQSGPLIFDNNGQVVWSSPVPAGDGTEDFRTQTYRGKTVLTWWQGKVTKFGYGLGTDVIMNSGYHIVASVLGGNGLAADGHEFLLTPQGSALVTEYSPVQGDLASVGGAKSATILDGVIQEVDVKTRLVMYEWHGLDHVPLTHSYSAPPTTVNGVYDYFHINSVEYDNQGHLLISARNTSALYDISPQSGSLLWRLGGKASSFSQGANVPFAYQHDAHMLPNGQVTLFDDDCCAQVAAGSPLTPVYQPNSRGEIVRLDSKHRSASLARQFVRPGARLVTASQGNLQALPNGNWMVGYGGLPNFTEFNSAGQVVFDGTFPNKEFTYRVFRFPWTAQPGTTPSVVAQPSGSGLRVSVSWNGATTVAAWKVLSGVSPSSLTPGATAVRSGFETAIQTPAAQYVEVQALSASGRVLSTSKPVHAGP
jgi:hypothetical protein